MKNIFHHSAAYIMKHKRHHHLIIGLIVVAVVGTGGVFLYKKWASAATFTFTQSSATGGWATQSSDTASHNAVPSNQTNWTKYSEATGVTPSASGVSLSSTSKTSVDDGVGLSAKTDYTVGAAPGGVTISADGASVYVANTNSSNISKFTRNTSTGALSAKTDYAAGANPGAITISADGTSVYVTDAYAPTVSMFTRNTSTGALSLKTDYTAGSNSLHGITVSADGTSVYVANGGPGTVSMFARNTSTGTLSAKTDYAAGTTPLAVTISADGASVYVVNTNSYTISKFTRNTSTGALSAKTDYGTGANPYDITISADGASVYVANYGSDTISKFTRDPSTGALSAKTDYATGAYPYAITISADGTSVYVTNDGPDTVSGFARNPSTGALSAKTDYATGANPYSITISADGASVYIANNSSASVSMYSRAVRGGALGFEAGTLTSTTVTGTGAGAGVGLAPSATNIALGKQATASQVYLGNNSAYGANNATDGSLGTIWFPGGWAPQWLYVDLGSVVPIDKVKVNYGIGDPRGTTYFTVDTSNDATNWTTRASSSCSGDVWKEVTGINATARYIRFYVTSHSGGSWLSLYEVEVYSPPYPSSGTFESATIDLGGKSTLGNLDFTSVTTPSSIGTWAQTSDTDFNAGTNSSTVVSGGSVGMTPSFNSTPTLMAQGFPSYQAIGLAVSGNYAYTANNVNGLRIYNITNPAAPTLLSGISNNPSRDIAVSGNYAYIASGSNGLKIFNISNPAAPTLAGTYDPNSDYAEGVTVSGNYAYVVHQFIGLKIVDISNPAAPSLAGVYSSNLGLVTSVVVSGNYAYITNGSTSGTAELQIVNISNPAAPTLAGAYNPSPNKSYYSSAVSGSYAYAVETDGLRIIDISNPTTPTLAGSYSSPNLYFYDIAVSGNYAYIASSSNGLKIFNISNPAAPTLVSNYDAGGFNDIAVSGNYAYVARSSEDSSVSSFLSFKLNNYPASGTYTSPIKQVGPGAGFGTVSWVATASGQTVAMKVRACDDSACVGESFLDVTNNTNLSTLSGFNNSGGWIQYQATLSTSNPATTPTLDSVSIAIQPLGMQVATSDSSSGPWTYYGPDGTANTYFTSSGTAIPSALSGKRYFRYKAYLSTADTAYTPSLDSLTLNYTQYGTTGTLTSSVYDTGSDDRVIGNIVWSADGTNADRTVKFQVRSSPDGTTTWSDWCGATNCTGSYFTVNTGVSDGLSEGHPLATDTNDRYFQYRAYLEGDVAGTPILTLVSVSYVGNAPPAVSNVVSAQVSDPLNVDNYGKVVITYDASDDDTRLGNAGNQDKVTPTLYQYSTTGSAPWTNITTGLSANAYLPITLTREGENGGTGHSPSVVWTPPIVIAYTATTKVRVTISDGEGANSTGSGESGAFTLDTTVPTIVTARMDSSGATDAVTITATDSSTLEYRLCNAADFAACATWAAITSGTPTPIDWTAVGTPTAADAETVYYQVRDLYGNVTANTIVAPATPSGFLNADVSNPAGQTFGESLSWIATPGFTTGWKYEVWSAITDTATTPPSSYAHLATTTTNVYAHTITTATTSARWYKIRTINPNGDISNFSTLMTEGDVPDSFGTTLPDEAAPVIASLTVVNIKNTSAEINFSTDELAVMQVFYGTASCSTPTPITSSYVTGHSVYLTDLLPNTTYYYCARVTDVLGNPSAITPGSTPTFTTVGGPVITNVTERELTDVSALIFWNTSTSSDSKVYYATTKASVNTATPVTGAAVTVAGTDGAYQHQVGLTGLTSGSKYYYKVVSADALDAGIISTDDNNGQYYSFVTLRDTTPPTIMGTSTPVLASDAAVIVWQTDEMATTKVEYGTSAGVYTKSVAEDTNFSIYHVATLSSATNNAHGASGDKNTLTPETTYYYKVTSKDAANNSSTSEGTFTTPKTGDVTIVAVTVAAPVNPNTSTVIPDTTAPTVSNVKVDNITPFSAVVSFDTSESAYATLKYGKDTSYGDAASDDVWGATHTIKLRGLTLGTEYHIKVTAHDKAGNTGTSDDQTFKTPFLSENLKDMTKIENIEQFQKEIEETIESILPSLVPPFVSKPVVSDITENGATVSFRTNIRAFPVVGFVEDGTYDTTKDNPYSGEISDMAEKASDHTIALTGLKQNTKYHLQARAFSLPKVIGKSADITFTTKASKISGSIVERKKDSFTVVWTTDESTTSIVEYKNLKTRITERKTDDVKRTAHSMKIDNLPSGTTYEVDISGINEQGNVVEAGATLTVTTSRDVTEPIISGFKVDNALVPGRTDRIQTIVSWKTDEAANSTVYYEEGAGTAGDTRELANKNEVLESYITAHSVILPNLKPGTIYRLKVTSSDDSGNDASFGPRTVITPRQTESITDIIFKNFEDSFKFLRKI